MLEYKEFLSRGNKNSETFFIIILALIIFGCCYLVYNSLNKPQKLTGNIMSPITTDEKTDQLSKSRHNPLINLSESDIDKKKRLLNLPNPTYTPSESDIEIKKRIINNIQ